MSESLQDGRRGGLGDGTGSPGASLGSDGDTLDDDGLDDFGARDGLRVQGRVERWATSATLALESVAAALEEAVGGTALDPGDEAGLLGDGGEGRGSSNSGGRSSGDGGRVSLGIGLSHGVCCGEISGAFFRQSVFLDHYRQTITHSYR